MSLWAFSLQVTVDVNVTFYEGKPWQAVLPHGLTTWTMSFDRCGTILKDLVRLKAPRGSRLTVGPAGWTAVWHAHNRVDIYAWLTEHRSRE